MSSTDLNSHGESRFKTGAGAVAGRLSGFAASTIITGVAGVAAVPLAIGGGGAEAWARLAAGQTIGGLFAIVVALGWGITGPAQIAALAPNMRWAVYRHSLTIRLILVLPLLACAIAVTAVVVPGDGVALVGAAAQCSAGLAAGWFFVGIGRPGFLILAETLPRAAGTIVGATLAALTGQLMWLAGGMLIAGLLIPILATLIIRGSVTRGGVALPLRFWGTAREQLPAVSTVLVSSTYMALPLIVVAAAAPQALVVFALADRLYKLATTALSPFGQVAQGWVPAGGPNEIAPRARRAAQAAVVLAVFVAAGFTVLAPVLGGWLSGGEVHIPLLLSLLLGVALGASFIAQIVGIAGLIAAGLVRWVFVSALAGGIVGTVVLLLSVPGLQALGAAAAVGAAEVVVAGTQLVVFHRWFIDLDRRARSDEDLPGTEAQTLEGGVASSPASRVTDSLVVKEQIASVPLAEASQALQTRPRVAMATVTYAARHASCIVTCEAALEAGATSVTIIANGVHADSLHALRTYASSRTGVKLLSNTGNEGSAPGFARALAAAFTSGEDYVWLLDDDNVASPDALRLALKGQSEWALAHGMDTANVAVACFRPEDPMQSRLFGSEAVSVDQAYNPAGSFLWRSTLRRPARGNAVDRFGNLSIPSAPYGGLLLPRAIVEQLAPPRLDLVLYQDDTEYTERLRSSGFELVLVPSARVEDPDRRATTTVVAEPHGMRGMLENAAAKPTMSYYMLRNTVILDIERAKRSKAVPHLLMNATIQIAAMTVMSLRSRMAFKGGLLAARAVVDGVRGRSGMTRGLL
jgi:GT2 family glycosyltransferase